MEFIYAQLDNEGFCIGVSSLSGEVIEDNLISILEFDISYINRKYDYNTKQWLDEYREQVEQDIIKTSSDTRVEELEDKLNKIMKHLGI
ncbi:MAG: hypothetical protein RR490_03370 [Niameybacter sp.]